VNSLELFNAMGKDIELFWKNFITDNTSHENEKYQSHFISVIMRKMQMIAQNLWLKILNKQPHHRYGLSK
jgi:murein endopeptidase